MTMKPRTALLGLPATLMLAACVCMPCACLPSAVAAPRGAARPANAKAPLPENVVAIVESHPLTFDAFCRVFVQHVAQDLQESKSGPRAVLDKLCEEMLIRQWCTKSFCFGYKLLPPCSRKWRN